MACLHAPTFTSKARAPTQESCVYSLACGGAKSKLGTYSVRITYLWLLIPSRNPRRDAPRSLPRRRDAVARCGSRGRGGGCSADRRQQPGCINRSCLWRAHGDALHGATPMRCAFRVAARRNDFAHVGRSPAQRCTHAVCVHPTGAPPAVNPDAARLGSCRCRVRNLHDA